MWKTKEIQSFGEIENHAFRIIINSDNNNVTCSVTPGTINNIMPSNLFAGSALAKFSISKDSIRYVILKVNTDGKGIVSAIIEIRTSPPSIQKAVPFSLPTSFEVLIGLTYGSQTYQAVTNNINIGGLLQYIESKSATEPGTLPYTPYFIWG